MDCGKERHHPSVGPVYATVRLTEASAKTAKGGHYGGAVWRGMKVERLPGAVEEPGTCRQRLGD